MINTLAGDPDEALTRIQQWAEGFEVKAQRYQEVAARTEELRLSAISPNGAVTVTVGADGGVTDLEFGETATRMALPELSAMVLDTMHRAQAGIADEVGEVLAEELGDDDPQTRTLVLSSLRERFPADESEVDDDDSDSDDDPLR